MARIEDYYRLLLYSLLFHVLIVFIMVVSFEWSTRQFVLENSEQTNNIINAVMINSSKVELPEPAPSVSSPSKLLQKTQLQKTQADQSKSKILKKLPEPVVQQKAIIIPDHHKKYIKQDTIQKELLADLKQAEKKKKQKHKELEKAFAAELKEQSAKSLQQQLLKEQNRLAGAAQASKMRGVVDKYKALILQSIAQHWLVPSGVDQSLSTELLIRLAPGGTVLDVQLVKTSGDDGLDRSARTAVFKSSPLPVPEKTDEFEPFREFILKVKPENIVHRDSELS